MAGGGLTPGDAWSVALDMVLLGVGLAVALLIVVLAAAGCILLVRSALHADLTHVTEPTVGKGQARAVGAAEPRLTPAADVPRPASPVDADAVRRSPGR